MQLDDGKSYLTRGGDIVGPLQFRGLYFCHKNTYAFDHDGARVIAGDRMPLDEPSSIVREWDVAPDNRCRNVIGGCESGTIPPQLTPEAMAAAGRRPEAGILRAAPGYEPLVDVFAMAHDHAAHGKGRERHVHGREAFAKQVSPAIVRRHGVGYATGQAAKKVDEAAGFVTRDELGAAVLEMLGAMNYLAMAILDLRAEQALRDRRAAA